MNGIYTHRVSICPIARNVKLSVERTYVTAKRESAGSLDSIQLRRVYLQKSETSA